MAQEIYYIYIYIVFFLYIYIYNSNRPCSVAILQFIFPKKKHGDFPAWQSVNIHQRVNPIKIHRKTTFFPMVFPMVLGGMCLQGPAVIHDVSTCSQDKAPSFEIVQLQKKVADVLRFWMFMVDTTNYYKLVYNISNISNQLSKHYKHQ